MAIALAAAIAAVGGVAFWQASGLPAEASTPTEASSEEKQHMQARLSRGVGSEVRFASAAALPAQVEDAVGSAADFIYWRSGLRMSEKTKRKLVAAESNVLKGKGKYISLAELTDHLTGAVVNRLATLTDEEIQLAALASSDEDGEIRSRADGKWGVLSRQMLVQQAESGREWSRQGDSATRAALRGMIEEEVTGRANTLGAALPEQFGQAGTRGFTPTQALLIAYSVAADDPLTDSRSDITQMMVQKRMETRQTREEKRANKGVSGHPYGPRGSVHPSAAHIFFKPAADKLLSRTEGGKK
jgi:hypothetical protein